MTQLLYFWIGTGIIFLIVEMITATLYGLSLAVSAFLIAVYVYLTGESELSLIQGVIFTVSSAFFAYILPGMIMSKTPDHPQGLDSYFGETRKVKKVGEDYKVTLDGVDYVVDIEGLKVGDKVLITSRKNTIFSGEII